MVERPGAPEEARRQALRPWRVRRVDDNGQVFLVAVAPSEAEARKLARELEARGHKQTYWVEPGGAVD